MSRERTRGLNKNVWHDPWIGRETWVCACGLHACLTLPVGAAGPPVQAEHKQSLSTAHREREPEQTMPCMPWRAGRAAGCW